MSSLRARRAASLLAVCALITSCVSCVETQNRRVHIGLEVETASIATVTTVSLARKQWERAGEVRMLGRHKVGLPAACTNARARRLMANVRFVLETFEDDHSRIDRSLYIFLTDRPLFYMSRWASMPPMLPPIMNYQIALSGVYCSPNEIALIVGVEDSLPSLYHELCHAVLPNAGGDHSNPKWVEWNARGDELSTRLRDRWR